MTIMREVRDRSMESAHLLGSHVPESLPLLADVDELSVSRETLVNRALAIYVAGAAAYGFDSQRGLTWLEENGATGGLTEAEREYLTRSSASSDPFKQQIEALWALYWCCSLASDSEFTFRESCPSDFVSRLPDLLKGECASGFRSSVELRSPLEVLRAADLAYCLHWALREKQAFGVTGSVPEYVVRERRKALDWAIEGGAWDEISLDT